MTPVIPILMLAGSPGPIPDLPEPADIVRALREAAAIENWQTTECLQGCDERDFWRLSRGQRVRSVACTPVTAARARCTYEQNRCTLDEDRDRNGWCSGAANFEFVGSSHYGHHIKWSVAPAAND